MSQQESNVFNASFVSLNTVLETFKSTLLPPNQLAQATPSMARTLLVAHSITHAATIELHAIFAQSNPTSRQKRLSAAQTIVGIIAAVTLRDFAHLNPIMGVSNLSLLLPLPRTEIHTETPFLPCRRYGYPHPKCS